MGSGGETGRFLIYKIVIQGPSDKVTSGPRPEGSQGAGAGDIWVEKFPG